MILRDVDNYSPNDRAYITSQKTRTVSYKSWRPRVGNRTVLNRAKTVAAVQHGWCSTVIPWPFPNHDKKGQLTQQQRGHKWKWKAISNGCTSHLKRAQLFHEYVKIQTEKRRPVRQWMMAQTGWHEGTQMTPLRMLVEGRSDDTQAVRTELYASARHVHM